MGLLRTSLFNLTVLGAYWMGADERVLAISYQEKRLNVRAISKTIYAKHATNVAAGRADLS